MTVGKSVYTAATYTQQHQLPFYSLRIAKSIL